MNSVLEPFGLCFLCTFLSACLQSTRLLLPRAPGLFHSLLASHWWLRFCVKAAEKKREQQQHRALLFLAGWIPGPVEHLLIYCSFHQLFLELFWSWADRSQLTKHKPRLGGSPRVCLALAAANGEAAFQGRLQHSSVWRQGETLSITWDRQPQT